MPEVDVVASVQEVRVRQDREPGVAQNHGRVPDQENRPLRPVGGGKVSTGQSQLIVPFHLRSPPKWICIGTTRPIPRSMSFLLQGNAERKSSPAGAGFATPVWCGA
jgi:hypothetical protein